MNNDKKINERVYLDTDYCSITKNGDVFVYKHFRESKSGLNYGPVAKWKLRTGMIYPHYMELQSSPIYLEVSDGIIFN